MTYIERIAIAIQHQKMGTWDGDDRDAIALCEFAKAIGHWSEGEQRELDAKLAELGIN